MLMLTISEYFSFSCQLRYHSFCNFSVCLISKNTPPPKKTPQTNKKQKNKLKVQKHTNNNDYY